METYTDERVPVIAEMLSLSSNLHYYVFGKPVASTLDGAIGGGSGIEKKTPIDTEQAMQRPRVLLQLGMNYRWSPIVLESRADPTTDATKDPYGQQTDKLRAGDRAPDAHMTLLSKDASPRDITIHSLKDLRKHIVLVFVRSAEFFLQFKENLGGVQEVFDKDLAILVIVLPQGADVGAAVDLPDANLQLLDKNGEARRVYDLDYERGEITYVIIRPDGVIGAVAGDGAGVRRYFDILKVGGRM